MKTIDFTVLFLENVGLYLSIWGVCLVLYRLVFWRTVKSIFDPLYLFVIFTNSICTADVIFLAVMGEIRQYYTYTYLLSEASLLAGILLLARPQRVLIQPLPRPIFVQRISFGMVLTIFLVIVSNFTIYADRGIPLLLESRNDASGGGSGFGFMTRLSQVAMSLFVLFYYVKIKMTGTRNSFAERIMLLASVVMGVLSGFKAFFIFYFFAYFVARGFTQRNSIKRDLQIVVLIVIFLLLIFGVVLGTTDMALVLAGLMSRLLASGDIYYMVFVNDTIKQLPSQDFFFQLSGQLLASFRLIDWSEAPLNYGYVVNEVVNLSDQNLGPTFRYNVLWLLLTGSPTFTILLSFVIGLVIGLMNRVLNGFTKPGFKFIVCAFFYYKTFLLILGPDHAINDIVLSLAILLPILLILFVPVPRFRAFNHLAKESTAVCAP